MRQPIGPETRADLERLISSKIEENGTLEYKAAGALDARNPHWKDEMTKDVSAFANAAGGVLVYGIQEFKADDRKHLPEKITPIDSRKHSREWFDQILGQIQPKIDGLEIRPIHVGPAPMDYCFAVLVPQGTTAHQSTDLKYHKRRNFETTPMEDYEIRDVMNRVKHPRISVEVRIDSTPPVDGPKVVFRITNNGEIMARHFAVAAKFPYDLGWTQFVAFNNGKFVTDGRESHWRISDGNGIGPPLFPKASRLLEISIDGFLKVSDPLISSIKDIRITAYADSMPPIEFRKDLEKMMKGWA